MPTYRELGEAEARTAIEACVAELRGRGKTGAVAVADRLGELIAVMRMDGAPPPAVTIASNKAYTSARVRGESGDLGRSANAEAWDVHFHGDVRYVGWDGGVPVMVDGACLGAIAVSGLSGVEDLEIARVGLTAVMAVV